MAAVALTAGVPPLFTRLPERLFGPLASANRQQYWALLCHLHAKRFGPDAPLPPSQGYTAGRIITDIEEELQSIDRWHLEDGESLDTPLKVRAALVLGKFEESGWLRRERHGFEKFVSMSPVVSQFLTQLIAFAETGPVFVSGKIRSIDLNLSQVLQGNAQGDTLQESADQARNLLVHVRNTGTSIRDLMDELTLTEDTAVYVRRFFTDYVERVFIGDYHELRTREHPLARRGQILRAVHELADDAAHRERLLRWYLDKRAGGDRARAEALFEKDLQRLRDLERIDEYLDRLDNEIRRANRKAHAVLEYRLRSLRPVETLVKHAIAAADAGCLGEVGADPFPPGPLLSASGLTDARRSVERAPPSALRRAVPSLETLAKAALRQRAAAARQVLPHTLAMYVRGQLKGEARVASESLSLDSVAALRAYQVLAQVAQVARDGRRGAASPLLSLAGAFRVKYTEDDEPAERPMHGRGFEIGLRASPIGGKRGGGR